MSILSTDKIDNRSLIQLIRCCMCLSNDHEIRSIQADWKVSLYRILRHPKNYWPWLVNPYVEIQGKRKHISPLLQGVISVCRVYVIAYYLKSTLADKLKTFITFPWIVGRVFYLAETFCSRAVVLILLKIWQCPYLAKKVYVFSLTWKQASVSQLPMVYAL